VSPFPPLSTRVLVAPTADGAVAYDLDARRLHELNRTGAAVAAACAQGADLDDTVETWAAQTGADPAVIAHDVRVALDSFSRLGLVGDGRARELFLAEAVAPPAALGAGDTYCVVAAAEHRIRIVGDDPTVIDAIGEWFAVPTHRHDTCTPGSRCNNPERRGWGGGNDGYGTGDVTRAGDGRAGTNLSGIIADQGVIYTLTVYVGGGGPTSTNPWGGKGGTIPSGSDGATGGDSEDGPSWGGGGGGAASVLVGSVNSIRVEGPSGGGGGTGDTSGAHGGDGGSHLTGSVANNTVKAGNDGTAAGGLGPGGGGGGGDAGGGNQGGGGGGGSGSASVANTDNAATASEGSAGGAGNDTGQVAQAGADGSFTLFNV